MDSFLYKEPSYKLLGLAFSVHNRLGSGLSESAYQGALLVELKHVSISLQLQQIFTHQLPKAIRYSGRLSVQLLSGASPVARFCQCIEEKAVRAFSI
jgi:GxxExxY protein